MLNTHQVAAVDFIGGDYINMEFLTGFQASNPVNISEFQLRNQTFPYHVVTGRSGSVSISGLLLDGDTVDLLGTEGMAFAFAEYNTVTKLAGPAGFAITSEGARVDNDGVFFIDASGAFSYQQGLDKFLYGTVLPNWNQGTFRNGTSTGFVDPIEGCYVGIHIPDAGSNVGSLNLSYYKGNTQYRLAADEDSNLVIPQLKIGQPKTSGGASIPSTALTGGRWIWNWSKKGSGNATAPTVDFIVFNGTD